VQENIGDINVSAKEEILDDVNLDEEKKAAKINEIIPAEEAGP
jgi:hypothetical protein